MALMQDKIKKNMATNKKQQQLLSDELLSQKFSRNIGTQDKKENITRQKENSILSKECDSLSQPATARDSLVESPKR